MSPLAALQRLLETPLGSRAGTLGYEVVARGAARLLHDVDDVTSVYLSGSFARRDASFRPGRSDLDLVLAFDDAGLERELAMRRALGARLRVLRKTLVVQTLDYVDAIDLPLVQRHGDAWSFELRARWRLLRGSEARVEVEPRAREEARVLALAKTMRRWAKAHPRLVAALASGSLSPGDVRAAERLLADCTALAADRAEASEPAERTLDAHVARCLAESLDALDRAARALTGAWPDARVEGLALPALGAAPRALAEAACREGFASVVCGSREPSGDDRLLFVIADERATPSDVIARCVRLARAHPALPAAGFPWARGAIPLTPALVRAGFLLDRLPTVGRSLASPTARLAGASIEAPLLPPPSLHEALLRSELARGLVRARSRTFHATSAPEGAVAFRKETAHLAGILGLPLDARAGRLDERSLLSVYRELQPSIRARLRSR